LSTLRERAVAGTSVDPVGVAHFITITENISDLVLYRLIV